MESLQRGGLLSSYSLLEPLGTGGEASVWSAWDRQNERVVALKTISRLNEDNFRRTYASATFERQVHLIASLDHPRILPIYRFGETDEQHYFVMRYAPGGSLANLLIRGAMPVVQVLDLCTQIVSALTYLHEHGIVHRDIKPSNLLLDFQHRVYLSDFGLARLLYQGTEPLHTGHGTRLYAPHEQFALTTISPQSDIYSLGIVIYEMLTGQLPWDGMDSLASRQEYMGDILPDLREVNPDLPPDITDVLRHMTAFNWRDRPSSVIESFDLLMQAIGGDAEAVARASLPTTLQEEALIVEDGKILLASFLPDFRLEGQVFPARLTHLAYIHSAVQRDEGLRESLSGLERQFMLRGALTYGYQPEYWWQLVPDPVERVQICLYTLLNETEESAIEQALVHLLGIVDEMPQADDLPAGALERLIQIATDATTWSLRQDALLALEALVRRSGRWQDTGISLAGDRKLAALALDGGLSAKPAARLIGYMGSCAGVQAVIETQGDGESDRILPVLEEIRSTAGSLPDLVPGPLRMRAALHNLYNQMFRQAGPAPVRALIGVLVGLLIFLLILGGLFSRQDAQMSDILFEPYPASRLVTIVAIDDDSLSRYGRWDSWSRSLHAALLQRLITAGARVVVFDISFDSASGEDIQLARAMEQAGNVILPVLGQGDAFLDRPGTVYFNGRLLPQPELLAEAVAVGHPNVLHDADGLLRRVPLQADMNGDRYPSLALAALQVALGEETRSFGLQDGMLKVAGRRIPVDEHGEMVIHFAGSPGEGTFDTVSYQQVLDGLAPEALFKDKIVLVGITASAEPDRYLTPVSRGRPMYGVEVIANIIETIWSGRFLRPAGNTPTGLLLIFLGLLTGLACSRPWRGLAGAAIIVGLYFFLVGWVFDVYGVMLSLFFPLLTIVLSYILVTTYKYAMEMRRRSKIVESFGRRLAPEMALATARAVQIGAVDLEGEVREVSALICVLRGYSVFSSVYEPHEVIEMVNRYWQIVYQVALRFQGTIGHREGRQALVFFNAPLTQAEHAWLAVQTALEILRQVEAFHQSLPEDHPYRGIQISFGVFTGKAVAGYVDTENRQEYTLVGETVAHAVQLANLAEAGQIFLNGLAYEKIAARAAAGAAMSVSSYDWALPFTVYRLLSIG